MSATARVPTGPLRGRATAARTQAARTQAARTPSARTPSARTPSARTTGSRTTADRTTATRAGATPRSSPSRSTGPVHVRPQLRLVTAPVGTPTRARRVATPRPRLAPFVVLVVSLLAATALGLLALNTAIAVDSLQASQQRAANTELSQRVDRLEQQVTTARSPAELAAAAVAAGLVPAGVAGHLVLGPDGTSVVRGTPVPATAPEQAPEPAAAPAADPSPVPQPGTEQVGG